MFGLLFAVIGIVGLGFLIITILVEIGYLLPFATALISFGSFGWISTMIGLNFQNALILATESALVTLILVWLSIGISQRGRETSSPHKPRKATSSPA